MKQQKSKQNITPRAEPPGRNTQQQKWQREVKTFLSITQQKKQEKSRGKIQWNENIFIERNITCIPMHVGQNARKQQNTTSCRPPPNANTRHRTF